MGNLLWVGNFASNVWYCSNWYEKGSYWFWSDIWICLKYDFTTFENVTVDDNVMQNIIRLRTISMHPVLMNDDTRLLMLEYGARNKLLDDVGRSDDMCGWKWADKVSGRDPSIRRRVPTWKVICPFPPTDTLWPTKFLHQFVFCYLDECWLQCSYCNQSYFWVFY